MPGLVFGKTYLEIAEIIYNHGTGDYSNLYSQPDYIDADNEDKRLNDEIKQLLLPEHSELVYEAEEAHRKASWIYDQHTYTNGFIDGLAVMQMLIFTMQGHNMDGQILRVLDGYYRERCSKDNSLDNVHKLLQSLNELVQNRSCLNDSILLEICRKNAVVDRTAV